MTWYQENRNGGLGGLTVIHSQFDLGVDVGDYTTVAAGYSADVVSGATALVYSTDAISSATTFSDTRHEGHASVSFEGSRSGLSLSAGAASERDYSSMSVGGSGNVYLPGKNTNLALSYTHNFDAVCDKDNRMVTPLVRKALTKGDPCARKYGLLGRDTDGITLWHDLTIDTVQGTMTQSLSPTSNFQFGLYGSVIKGFQSNPYRRVRVSGIEAQEAVPNVRGRLAATLRYNRYFKKLRSAVHLFGRGYSDTWGVNSGTVELGYSQYAGSNLLVRFRGRIYQQQEARFFKDAFFYDREGPAGAYFTGDRELGRLRHVITGAKLSYLNVATDGKPVFGPFDSLRLNLKVDLMFFEELAADDPAANIQGTGRQYLNSGKFLDAFVLQLGLLLSY